MLKKYFEPGKRFVGEKIVKKKMLPSNSFGTKKLWQKKHLAGFFLGQPKIKLIKKWQKIVVNNFCRTQEGLA